MLFHPRVRNPAPIYEQLSYHLCSNKKLTKNKKEYKPYLDAYLRRLLAKWSPKQSTLREVLDSSRCKIAMEVLRSWHFFFHGPYSVKESPRCSGLGIFTKKVIGVTNPMADLCGTLSSCTREAAENCHSAIMLPFTKADPYSHSNDGLHPSDDTSDDDDLSYVDESVVRCGKRKKVKSQVRAPSTSMSTPNDPIMHYYKLCGPVSLLNASCKSCQNITLYFSFTEDDRLNDLDRQEDGRVVRVQPKRRIEKGEELLWCYCGGCGEPDCKYKDFLCPVCGLPCCANNS